MFSVHFSVLSRTQLVNHSRVVGSTRLRRAVDISGPIQHGDAFWKDVTSKSVEHRRTPTTITVRGKLNHVRRLVRSRKHGEDVSVGIHG